MSNRDIGKLYSESVLHKRFDAICDRFNEDTQMTVFDQPTTKKRAKELVKLQNPELKGKALDAEVNKRIDLGYGEDDIAPKDTYDIAGDFTFGDEHLDKLNSLSIEGKNRVANLIDDAFTKDIKKTLQPKLSTRDSKGKENTNTLNKAVDMLKYSPLPLGMIVTGLKNEYSDTSRGGTLINSNLFTSPGYYPISDLFLGDASQSKVLTNSLAHLRQLGVGAGQAGPYEQALAVFDKNITVGDKGDIIFNDELFEVKAEDGRIGPSEYPAKNKMLETVYKAADTVMGIYTKYKLPNDYPGNNKYFAKKGITYQEIFNFRQEYIAPLVTNYDGENVAYVFISTIVKQLYSNNPLADEIITSFADMRIDYRSFIHTVIRQLFSMYKNEKSQGAGAWDYLLGINANGGFAVIQTADDLIPQIGGPVNFAEQYSISVVATGTDATRDYMFSFTPIV